MQQTTKQGHVGVERASKSIRNRQKITEVNGASHAHLPTARSDWSAASERLKIWRVPYCAGTEKNWELKEEGRFRGSFCRR